MFIDDLTTRDIPASLSPSPVLFAEEFTGSDGAAWDTTQWTTTTNDSTKTADIQANEAPHS